MEASKKRFDQHHLFWRKRAWNNASELHKRTRLLSSYTVYMRRYWHDELHARVEPLNPPHNIVVSKLGELGMKYASTTDDARRLYRITSELTDEAATSGKQFERDYIAAAVHLEAQVGILSYAENADRKLL